MASVGPQLEAGFGRLTITVHAAKDLYDTQLVGKQDPFCLVQHNGKEYRTKTHKDGGRDPQWQESFNLILRKPGEDVCIWVYADSTLTRSLIGLTFLDCDRLIKEPMPKWYRIGRDTKQSTDAGLIQVSTSWEAFPQIAYVPQIKAILAPDVSGFAQVVDVTPAPAPAPGPAFLAANVGFAKLGDDKPAETPAPPPVKHFGPAGFNPDKNTAIDFSAPSDSNISGSYRVYTKDAEGKERSYTLELVHTPDGKVTGHGEAAHMSYTADGHVVDDQLVYSEVWAGLGVDKVNAQLTDNGRSFECNRADSLTAGRRVNTITKESHPKFFLPYYNISGEWRVYAEHKSGEKQSYSLQIKQHEDGKTLSGGGDMQGRKYTIKGQLEKNVIKYTEIWGPGQEDVIFAELNPNGAYFSCRTQHALVQEAKRVDSLTEKDKLRYYVGEHKK